MYVFVCIYAWCPRKPEEGMGFPGARVIMDGCETSWVCRELNPDTLEEQQLLITAISPAPIKILIKKKFLKG